MNATAPGSEASSLKNLATLPGLKKVYLVDFIEFQPFKRWYIVRHVRRAFLICWTRFRAPGSMPDFAIVGKVRSYESNSAKLLNGIDYLWLQVLV